MKDKLQLCKEKLPMPLLWEKLSLHGKPTKSCRSPFRKDKHASFSVFQTKGQWFFKDHADPDIQGDEVNLIMLAKDVDMVEAIRIYHEMAEVSGPEDDCGQLSKK